MITVQDIEEGLRQHQFELYYQPKLSLVSGQIAGSEALIRWIRPDGSMPKPVEFIPLAEHSPLIKKITSYILPILMHDLPALSASQLTPLSFNVSARDFEDDIFARRMLDAIAQAGVAANALVIELTENEALACDESIRNNLLLLRRAGVGLSMDDYGLGYSSADTLSRWPFSSIKIDQGLIGRMLDSAKNALIVRSAIRLGHELRIDVIAEGVETVEQFEFLLEAGCQYVQGYLICRPLPLQQLMTREHDHRFARVPVGLIHMAIIDHLQWRRQFVGYALRRANLPADSAIRLAPDYPALSHRECSLGRWLYGAGQKFAERDDFKHLEVVHRALHVEGMDLVRRIQGGAGPAEVAAGVARLQDASMQVLGQLTLLENFELGAAYQDDGR